MVISWLATSEGEAWSWVDPSGNRGRIGVGVAAGVAADFMITAEPRESGRSWVGSVEAFTGWLGDCSA